MKKIIFDETQDSLVESEMSLRVIGVADLLGIRSHEVPEEVLQLLQHTTVLITGAGGTIGGALAQKLAPVVSKLVLLDSHEPSLARIMQAVRAISPTVTVVPLVTDLKNQKSVRQVLKHHAPTTVFHTAAFKHVDIAEANPLAVVQNNFLVSTLLASECAQAQVEHFLFTSSDKAVSPRNILGASKRAVERYLLNMETTMNISAVRFVNVVGSSGSVVKVFENQINTASTVRVTDPAMERYIVSVADAVYLMLTAVYETEKRTENKQLYMLDPGEPIAIKDIAQKMITLSGKNVQIEFTNVRPGEKINEDLLYNYETLETTTTKDVMRITFPKEHAVVIDPKMVEHLTTLLESGETNTDTALAAFLRSVPEYKK